MLGVCLLFVGIVLINNGMCTLYHVDGRSAAVMNIFTGGLSLFINFVNLVQGNYYAAGTGLLFCFTYLFVAVNKFLNASPQIPEGTAQIFRASFRRYPPQKKYPREWPTDTRCPPSGDPA